MLSILVPLDESPAAEAVLPLVGALAGRADARLILVRVPDRPPPGVRPYEVSGGAVSYAEEYLAGTADRLRALGLRAESETLPEGPVPQAVLDAVREKGADLVAMATHGRSGLGRWTYGNVTNGVVARCPVPVLLARSWLGGDEGAAVRDGLTVLAPQDGSSTSAKALPYARWLAGAMGVEVRSFQAPERPGPAVSEEAQRLDAALVVMSTHGRGAPGRQVLGGVADYVLRVGTRALVLVGSAVAERGGS